MHAKVAKRQQTAGLERVLEALGQELIESTDEELLKAARDLGMDPSMRGSAAFIGLKYSDALRMGMSDWFEAPVLDAQGLETERKSDEQPPLAKRVTARKTRSKPPSGGGSEFDSN